MNDKNRAVFRPVFIILQQPASVLYLERLQGTKCIYLNRNHNYNIKENLR